MTSKGTRALRLMLDAFVTLFASFNMAALSFWFVGIQLVGWVAGDWEALAIILLFLVLSGAYMAKFRKLSPRWTWTIFVAFSIVFFLAISLLFSYAVAQSSIG
jgi:hypothetical protein